MIYWPVKEEWQRLTSEQKLIWSIRILQDELRKQKPLSDTAKEAIILGDFAVEDA